VGLVLDLRDGLRGDIGHRVVVVELDGREPHLREARDLLAHGQRLAGGRPVDVGPLGDVPRADCVLEPGHLYRFLTPPPRNAAVRAHRGVTVGG
jgi:hypothetical protein